MFVQTDNDDDNSSEMCEFSVVSLVKSIRTHTYICECMFVCMCVAADDWFCVV